MSIETNLLIDSNDPSKTTTVAEIVEALLSQSSGLLLQNKRSFDHSASVVSSEASINPAGFVLDITASETPSEFEFSAQFSVSHNGTDILAYASMGYKVEVSIDNGATWTVFQHRERAFLFSYLTATNDTDTFKTHGFYLSPTEGDSYKFRFTIINHATGSLKINSPSDAGEHCYFAVKELKK